MERVHRQRESLMRLWARYGVSSDVSNDYLDGLGVKKLRRLDKAGDRLRGAKARSQLQLLTQTVVSQLGLLTNPGA